MHHEVSAPRYCAPANGCFHRTALIKDKVRVPSRAVRLWNPPDEDLTSRPIPVTIHPVNDIGD